ncbi:hypothetical protein QQF73_15080 [Marinobacter sp. M216]|uniref:Uncharacterized protein n=1 Tax=Marinobacter albus TaxID=3030833 RepID=A0ABT7HF08_9GAMM|nr:MULTISPECIES: hypothetical protein [unclassified Marinobacter]MDK9558956.1 hypothetical protein [Marinobacter sp. M216]
MSQLVLGCRWKASHKRQSILNKNLPSISPRLGYVLLALMTAKEEDEVVMEALLGLPFQFPGVAQQMIEHGVGVRGEAKLFPVVTGRLIVNVGAVKLAITQVYPNDHQSAVASKEGLHKLAETLVIVEAVTPVSGKRF